MSNSLKTQKRSFFSRAVAGLVLVALTAACNSPTAPPSQGPSQPAPPSRNWPNLAGMYLMTLSASSRCRLELPEAMRTRTYTAAIDQAGGSLTGTLVGPTFFPGWGDRFTGVIGETDNVIFQYEVEEWLEQGFLQVVGRMTGTIVEEGLSGFLEGEIQLILSGSSQLSKCTAPDHSVKFSR